MEAVIETKNLTKTYGKNRGINDVSITVNKGDIFGFLGPNGAGKSTTIRILLDFIRPTSGSASIFGMDCNKDSVAIRKRISYIPGDVSLYGNMTGQKFLEYFGKVRGNYDAESARMYAEKFDIMLDRRIKEYSKGMRQKVALIQAFMNDPDLIIMDEPTSGLDPLMQQTFMDVCRDEAKKGKTIFMSSHLLHEAEKVCNRVAIIREGRVVAQENMEGLQKKSGKIIEVKFKETVDPGTFVLRGVTGIVPLNGSNSYRISVTDNIEEVITSIASHKVVDINIHPMTLEDIFMQYYSGGK